MNKRHIRYFFGQQEYIKLFTIEAYFHQVQFILEKCGVRMMCFASSFRHIHISTQVLYNMPTMLFFSYIAIRI